MPITDDFLFDIVDHYMSEERQAEVSSKIKSATTGSIIFSTYYSSAIVREVFVALCEKCDVKFTEERSGNVVRYRKL